MSKMKEEYIEKIYAGWLAKIIGIRLGAPIEGWTYQRIKDTYNELTDYPVNYREFAADDDSNGPIFFLRALEDSKNKYDIEAQDVADALLNYAPYEHGFFWWGGYGISTEHTAYLNLRNGIPAPRSGSFIQNGPTIAEQIGGQIFIDTWGLVCPGNPDKAAVFAQKAASVTHDGNGVYGGIFIATCIATAFTEHDITMIIEKGLSYIPTDSEYTRVVRAVMEYHSKNPNNWRDCFQYVYENFGYDKYKGNCHIIPNIAVMILALLYGNGVFADTLNICNMCGWDTDCNVGNVATIMGVRNGIDDIDYERWRKPINDFFACSSVIGSLNIMDIPFAASYITKLAWSIAGEELPKHWNEIITKRIDSCHFEYSGSTHAIRLRTDSNEPELRYELTNTDEAASSGNRSLKINARSEAKDIYVYKKTYYFPSDFHDSRYNPAFSPLVYPGQTVHGSVFLPNYGDDYCVSMYVHNSIGNETIKGESTVLLKDKWQKLSLDIPCIENALIDEVGFVFTKLQDCENSVLRVMIDDLYFDSKPSYSLDASYLNEEAWTSTHREISQFTLLKGLFYLQNDLLHLSCSDFAEAYTGRYDWEDYSAEFILKPIVGKYHMVNLRVGGAIRSYAAAFMDNDRMCLLKNNNGYKELSCVDFNWSYGKEYVVLFTAQGNSLSISIDGIKYITYIDNDNPYMKGGIGVSVREGSHCSYRSIKVY